MIKSNTEIAYRVFDGVFTGGLGGGVVNNGYTDGSTPAQITDYIAPTDYETDGTEGFYTDMRGNRLFEGKNHLGNVLVVFSDRKIPEEDNGDIAYYTADVISYSDYHPFHSLFDNRLGNEDAYRYGGANGQEKVDEISGSGNHYTAPYWEYNPRIARRWNIDPVVKHHESPYACYAGNPILFVDPNGDDWYENNSYDPEVEGSKQYEWFEGNQERDGYTHIGEYLVSFDETKDELMIQYQNNTPNTVSMTSEKGLMMKMLFAEGGFSSKNTYGLQNDGGVETSEKHGGVRESYYGLLIISASILNRRAFASFKSNSSEIKDAFGDGETIKSVLEANNQYHGKNEKAYKNFSAWYKSLPSAGLSKKDIYSFIGDSYHATILPQFKLMTNFDIGFDAYYITAYSHNGVGNLLYQPYTIDYNSSNTLITNVEGRGGLRRWLIEIKDIENILNKEE